MQGCVSIRRMRRYRMGRAAELLGVSADTLRRWADGGRLRTARTEGGHRTVEGADLARFAAELAEHPEPDVIAARSARNRFTGLVTKVVKDTVMAHVEVQAGPFRVVSLMSREA